MRKILLFLILISYMFQGCSTKQKAEESTVIDAGYLGSSAFDPQYLKDYYNTRASISCWMLADDQDEFERIKADNKFDIPCKIDFDKYTALLSFGIRIHGITGTRTDEYGIRDGVLLTITMDHIGIKDTVFLYQIRKDNYIPCDIACPANLEKDGKIIGYLDSIIIFMDENHID